MKYKNKKSVALREIYQDQQYSAIFATLKALKEISEKYGYSNMKQLEQKHLCILPFYYRHPECITNLSA